MGHANKGKEVSICVVDADGAVAAEGKVATEPALILSWIGERIGAVERIVHESGPLSIWLTRELAGLGAPVLCSFCEIWPATPARAHWRGDGLIKSFKTRNL